MSGNSAELPFPEILLLAGVRSDGLVNLETDRAPLSVQLRSIFTATRRPILPENKCSNRLSQHGLGAKHVFCPSVPWKGAKLYSFWVGFHAARRFEAKIHTSRASSANSGRFCRCECPSWRCGSRRRV